MDHYPLGLHAMPNEDAMIYDDLYNTIPDNTKVDGTFQRLRYINDRRADITEWLKPNITVTEYTSDDFCVIQFRGGEYLITCVVSTRILSDAAG